MTLNEAVATLTSAQADLDLIARGLPVDATEVANMMTIADADSAEMVALKYLAKYNPIPQATITNATTNDTHSEQQ